MREVIFDIEVHRGTITLTSSHPRQPFTNRRTSHICDLGYRTYTEDLELLAQAFEVATIEARELGWIG